MERDSYIFYRNWWMAFRNLPDELRLKVYDGIMQYAFDNSIDGIPIVVKGFIDMAKPLIDKDRQRYEAICERNRINGNKPKKQKANLGSQTKPNKPVAFLASQTKPNEAHNYNDNDIINNNNKKPIGYEKFNFDFVEDNFKEAFYDWLDYKKGKGKKYRTQKSLEAAYKKLKECANGNAVVAKAVVEQSMANNWDGLFVIKTDLFVKEEPNTGVIQKEGFEWK